MQASKLQIIRDLNHCTTLDTLSTRDARIFQQNQQGHAPAYKLKEGNHVNFNFIWSVAIKKCLTDQKQARFGLAVGCTGKPRFGRIFGRGLRAQNFYYLRIIESNRLSQNQRLLHVISISQLNQMEFTSNEFSLFVDGYCRTKVHFQQRCSRGFILLLQYCVLQVPLMLIWRNKTLDKS